MENNRLDSISRASHVWIAYSAASVIWNTFNIGTRMQRNGSFAALGSHRFSAVVLRTLIGRALPKAAVTRRLQRLVQRLSEGERTIRTWVEVCVIEQPALFPFERISVHQRAAAAENYPRANFFSPINLAKSVENYKCQDHEELIRLFLFPVRVYV